VKRCALKRKTGLKRTTRLKPASKKHAAALRVYWKAVIEARAKQIAERGHTYCVITGEPCDPDPHHPKGRVGRNLLNFMLISRRSHDEIHNYPNAARAAGYLT
jgi:hypothetical protein